MKRISRLLATVMLALCLCIPTAQAAAGPTLAVSSGEVTAGGEVTLTVSATDNPGIAATLVYIYYDTSAFTVDIDKDLAAAGSFRSTGGIVSNTIAVAKQSGRYDGEADKDGVLAFWYNGSGLDTTGDGAFLTLTLHANSTAANGSYEVSLGCAPGETCNAQLEDVVFAASSGTVTLTGGSSRPQTSPGTPETTTPTTPDKSDTTAPGTTNPGSTTPGTTAPGTTTPSTTTPGTPTPGTTTPGTTAPGTTAPETTTPSTPNQTSPAVAFSDVSGNWAEESIKDAANRGLIVGDQGLYRPNDTMSRAELVTILWRTNGSPSPAKAASFTDLTQDWYKDAVAWAESIGVVTGVGNGKFDPNGNISREQLAAVLHRMAGSPTGMEAILSSVYDGYYPDSGEISGWAKQSLYWTVYSGIYCGESDYTFSDGLAPKAAANRAQIAVMMVHYLDKFEKGEGV